MTQQVSWIFQYQKSNEFIQKSFLFLLDTNLLTLFVQI